MYLHMDQRLCQARPERPSVKYLAFGALLSVLIGIVAFAPIWMRNQGRLMEYGDYYPQYVPFLLEMKRMVQSGSLSWSWNSFLGDSFVSAYSYYTVFNPFAWFVVAFPESMILYATMITALLKLAVSTVGAMLYLRLFVKKDPYALIGALLYTFSGFTVVNTSFYFFQDVISLFPFMMYGLERLIQYGRSKVYVAALAVNAVINFYFFVSTVILTVLYVLFRLELYRLSGWKRHGPTFVRIAVYSVVGTGIAGIALVPSLYAILGSTKAAGSLGNARYVHMYSLPDLLERLRVLVAPIESNTYHAFYDASSWCSVAAYVPVFGCFFAAEWCFRKRDWLQKLLIVLAVCYVVPVLNSMFNLFTAAHYSRWLYGAVLLMVLATVQRLEEWEQSGKPVSRKLLLGYIVVSSALTLIPAAANLMCRFGICLNVGCAGEYFFGFQTMAETVMLTLLNYLVLWMLLHGGSFSRKKLLLWTVAVCAANYCAFNAWNYDPYYENHYKKTLVEGINNPEASYDCRIDYPEEIMNYGMFRNYPAVHSYNSMQNMGSVQFAMAAGFIQNETTVFLDVPQAGREVLDALLSVRYFMDYDQTGAAPEGFSCQRTENGVAVYENQNYIPMGFAYDGYVLQEDLEEVPPERRAEIMLSALVISETDEAVVSMVLPRLTELPVMESLEQTAAQRRENSCSFFEGTPRGFTAQITLPQSNVVFFSIPNDPGWEITVNGEEAEVVQVHYGLMGVVCEEGDNTVEAVYHTRGLMPGVGCSVLFLVLFALGEAAGIRKKRSTKHE